MIKKQSDDPDVEHAAAQTLAIVNEVLTKLPRADTYDYGGHNLKLGEYGVCEHCTSPIAEAQTAEHALRAKLEEVEDETVKEHLELVIRLFKLEADAAVVRAEFHNGNGTEKILNAILGFQFARGIGDDYKHSHHQGA